MTSLTFFMEQPIYNTVNLCLNAHWAFYWTNLKMGVGRYGRHGCSKMFIIFPPLPPHDMATSPSSKLKKFNNHQLSDKLKSRRYPINHIYVATLVQVCQSKSHSHLNHAKSTCLACSTDSLCRPCLSNSTCLACSTGSLCHPCLSNSTCLACSTGSLCRPCLSNSTCLACSTGSLCRPCLSFITNKSI